MNAKEYNEVKARLEKIEAMLNGGSGSGNFGHAGRPGEVGGSAPEGKAVVGAKAYKAIGDSHRKAKKTDASVSEMELKDFADEYGKNTSGDSVNYLFSKLNEKTGKMEIDPDGLYSRKNKEITKKLVDGALEIQKMAREIAHSDKLSKQEKGTLIDSCVSVYSQMDSALYRGGKFEADDSFTASSTWGKLDSSDELTGKTAKKYAKRLRELGDSTYEMHKAKESSGKTYSWDEFFDAKNSLQDKLNQIIGKIDTVLNGGPGSGNFGHSGRPGMVGGSGKTNGPVKDLAKGIVDRVRETGGFTVNAKGEFFDLGKTKGYGVGGFSNEASCSTEEWANPSKRSKFLKNYIKENATKLMDADNCLGGWESDGKVYLDISRVFSSRKEATIAAMKTDQDSITDFKQKPGSGKEWPETKDLVKKYGLEKEYQKYKGIREAERKKESEKKATKTKDDDRYRDIPF